MFGRPFRILLLAFQAVWLGAIVPGHTRGVVALPGSGSPAAGGGGSACCAPVEERSCHAGGGESRTAGKSGTGGKGQPGTDDPAQRASHCAVCFFAVRMTLPPVVDLTAPPLELLDVLSPDVAPDFISLPPVLAYLARGPPAA